MLSENGKSVFEDATLEISIGVDPIKDHIDIAYHRPLSCIRIKAKNSNSHFIQFVTRQVPDNYSFIQSKGQTLVWEGVTDFYMTDHLNPHWKLDVTESHRSCYYEEQGLHQQQPDSISMYDDPTGAYVPEEERAVFCTFVIQNNKITHLVQWSWQNVQPEHSDELSPGYAVHIINMEGKTLPLWAIKLLIQFYKAKDSTPPDNLVTPELIEKLRLLSLAQLDDEARQYFLQAPERWITFLKHPKLFVTTSSDTPELGAQGGAAAAVAAKTAPAPHFTPAATTRTSGSSSSSTVVSAKPYAPSPDTDDPGSDKKKSRK